MKHLDAAGLGAVLKKIILFSFLFPILNFAHGQCPVPFPKGDIDSTYRNVPVATVVTRNDFTYFSSGIGITGDSLSINLAPTHGTVVVLNDSTIQYTPDPGYVGTDFYIYTVCNYCGNCAQASVSINVKAFCPAPTAKPDYFTVYNNVPTTLPVTLNDTNIAGGPLVVSVLHGAKHGTLAVSGNQFVYTCTQPGYLGADTFAYLERDTCPLGSNTDSAYVYLIVVTCQPVVAVNDTFAVQQQSALTANLAINDINVTGFGNITTTLLNTPKFGGTASVSGSNITYNAGGNAFGIDSIRYKICTDCGCDSAYAFFNVTEKPCSRPTAVADSVYTGYLPNCTNTYQLLTNDTLPINGGNVTVTIASAPTYGTATISTSGVLSYNCSDSANRGVTDFFTYSVCNACLCDTGFVAVHITVYPCNGLNPVVNADSGTVCNGVCTYINVSANDYSPQSLTVTAHAIVTAAAHGSASVFNGNTVKYCPNNGFVGVDSFVYQACDNGTPSLCNTATVKVNVVSCNAPPQILNTAGNVTDTLHITVKEDSSRIYCFTYLQADSPEVIIAFIDSSIDTLHATSTGYNTNPCLYIAPPNNSRAQQTVEVIVCNQSAHCDTVLLIISVIPVNHAPVAKSDTIHYNWLLPCTSVNVLNNDFDIDTGDHMKITAYNTTTPKGGVIAQIGDSSFCYTADTSFTGIDTFRYTICDTSGLCDSAIVIVIVPIQARNDQGFTIQDSAIILNVTNNDTRTNGDYISLCSQPLHGTVAIDSGNIVQYTPVHDYPVNPISKDTTSFVGVDSFCYTLCTVVGTDTSCANAEVYIMISPKARFYIPQGISPNGDGINDVFVVTSDNEFPLSQLLVYNRYGDEVWRNDGDGYQNNFDGTWKKNGQPLPDGAYWYIFKFNDGVTPDRMGYIVIQR